MPATPDLGLEWIEVPAGRYVVGVEPTTALLAEVPRATWDGVPMAVPLDWIVVDSFRMTRDPLSFADWERLAHRVQALPDEAVRPSPIDDAAEASFEDAAHIAASLGVSLPYWYEWEIAARGPEPFLYPWGNELDRRQLTLS